MHSPLAPVHRLIGGVLIAMVLAFTAWAAFGQLDIVVQAQGKVTPVGAVKVPQPVESGPVVELHVRDGQAVQAGELLARLDNTQSTKDTEALSADQVLERARLVAVDAALKGKLQKTGVSLVDAEFRLRMAAYQDAQRGAVSAVSRARAELGATRQSLEKQKQTLALAERSEAMYAGLKAQGLTPETSLSDRMRERIEREQDARALEATVRANEAAVAQAESALAQVTSDFHRQLAQEQTQAHAQLQKTQAELAKAQHRSSLAEVRAPVAGVVTSMAVRTVGQVVSAGSALMSLVPSNEALIVEAWVRNEDAGFVSPGMPVKVKLATFPFQKYGWLTGEVTWIGADSEVPESMRNVQGEPLFYKARIKMESYELVRDGKAYPARAGMQATVDIQLGERSLLEYLTSPLKRAVLEAARER